MQTTFRFSFGPWNIHEGADPFGPPVRDSMSFAQKLKLFKPLGFDGVQFHDDDAVPDLNDLDSTALAKKAKEVKSMLDGEGLVADSWPPALGRPAHDRRRLHRQRSCLPHLRHRAQSAGHRHCPCAGHQADRALAGPRRHLRARIQGQQALDRVSRRGHQPHAGP